jgi:integrase/recombinase XerD
MPATISILLDTRRIKKSSKYPVKLRVTFERATEYYSTIFDLSKVEYDKLTASRISVELKKIRSKLRAIESTAETSANNLDPFNFPEFEKDFIQHNNLFQQKKLKPEIQSAINDSFDYRPFHKKFPILLEEIAKPGTIHVAYLAYVKMLLREGRIGTAVTHHGSYVSLKKFRGNVRFNDITTSYLIEYENWLLSQDISKTTVGFYIRPLRSLFNVAIDDGIIKQEKYPFGKRKYRIPTSRNVKKALELSDVKKIYYYECNHEMESEQRARDFWLFSYFGNGMNAKDIAFLKYKNIHDDYLIFDRSKTERSMRSNPKPISVFISEDMKSIIERWGNKEKSATNYIFPILEKGMTALRQYELIQLFVSFINEWMKRILKTLGINKKATTYVARHTFSTVLKRSGVSTEYIQEALGHTDVKTTENYLDSFGKEIKKEHAGRLTSFKNEAKTDFDSFVTTDEKPN